MITGWIVLAVLAQKATETPSRSRDDVVVVHDTYSACMITPVDRSLEWIPAGGEYRCGGRTISRSSIDELRRLALGSRKDPPDVVETLGLSPQLVERHRSEIRREFEGFEGVLDSNHHPVPLPDYLEPLLEYNEIARWILDCLHREEPWSTTRAHVDVELPGDPPIRLRCWSNLGWKLPWEIESSGRVWSSLRPEISRAVLALIDPDSPNRAELDGASYWIEEFWDDFGDFYDLYDRRSAVSASKKYDQVAGYSDIAPWFHVDSSRASAVGAVSVVFDLTSLAAGPIQCARWLDPMDGWAPENSWSDFLGVWNEASEVVAQHLWIDAWRLGGTDRCVRFLAVGKKPQADGDRAKNVDAAWKSAGFRGAPGIQIELQRGRTTAAVVYLAKNEPGALIVSAIPGPGDHWLDRLDVSFHWRTPTYVRVDASGKREIRTMAPLPDPMDKNPLKCR